MKQFLMRNFALTDQGAKGVFKAGMASFVISFACCDRLCLFYAVDDDYDVVGKLEDDFGGRRADFAVLFAYLIGQKHLKTFV